MTCDYVSPITSVRCSLPRGHDLADDPHDCRAYQETTMTKPTEPETPKRRKRAPATMTPLALAAHVHAVTAGWDAAEVATYERVLAALRGV